MAFRSDLYGSIPGFSTAYETYENHFRWGRDWAGLIVGVLLDGTARDAGSSPTTVLRPGLVLGQIAASGTWRDYGANNTDGSDQAGAVLLSSFRMTDLDANNVQRFVWVLVGGPVKAARMFGLDEQARATMAGRFVFDDRNYVQNKYPFTRTIAKTANYTVVAADTGTLFTTTGAGGAVTFTLPAIAASKGMFFRFMNTVDQNMTVTAPAGKLVAFNNASATSVSLQTGGGKIGSGFDIVADEASGKWLALPIGAGTVTVA
jgi:hypothetical protein